MILELLSLTNIGFSALISNCRGKFTYIKYYKNNNSQQLISLCINCDPTLNYVNDL